MCFKACLHQWDWYWADLGSSHHPATPQAEVSHSHTSQVWPVWELFRLGEGRTGWREGSTMGRAAQEGGGTGIWPSPSRAALIWAAAGCSDLYFLNSRRRAKQPHRGVWALPQSKGTNTPLPFSSSRSSQTCTAYSTGCLLQPANSTTGAVWAACLTEPTFGSVDLLPRWLHSSESLNYHHSLCGWWAHEEELP